jgi:hypothetical protein
MIRNAPFLSDDEIKKLEEFVKAGGGLYIDGTTNFKLVQKLLGLVYIAETEEKITYIAPSETLSVSEKEIFGEMYSSKYPLACKDSQILADNPLNHKVLATITLPYTNPNDNTRFASIHSNPPGIHTKYPSLIYGKVGKGAVIWSASVFENNTQKAHKKIFAKLIKKLHKEEFDLTTDALPNIQFTVFDDINCSYINIINVHEVMPIIKIPSFTINIKCNKKVESVKLLPNEENVAFSFKDGILSFTAKELYIYDKYKISYES